MPGSRIPSGANFREAIGREATQSEYIIALITPAFMQSPFCWSELGAGWVLGGRLKPFVVAPVTYSSVTSTVIGDLQCLRFVAADLAQFRDELSSLYEIQTPTDRWEHERDRFLADMKSEAPKPGVDVQMPPELDGKFIIHGTKQAVLGARVWEKSISWQQAFINVARIIDCRNEAQLRGAFAASVLGVSGPAKINDADWAEIMLKLNLSKLVMSEKRSTMGGGFHTFCSLTPEGRKLFNALQET